MKRLYDGWFRGISHGEKVLNWRLGLGTSELKKGRNILRVSNLQLFMIMLFEEGAERRELPVSKLRSIECSDQAFYLNLFRLITLKILIRTEEQARPGF
jgi:hypothetical protein